LSSIIYPYNEPTDLLIVFKFILGINPADWLYKRPYDIRCWSECPITEVENLLKDMKIFLIKSKQN